MMLPMPQGGYPAGDRAAWPDTQRTPQEWFALQVFADVGRIAEIQADRNRVRMQPTARQIEDMHEAIEWVFDYVGDLRLRKLTFARSLKHPVSDKYLVSYAKLGRQFGLHKNTMISWHDKALAQISQGLAAV